MSKTPYSKLLLSSYLVFCLFTSFTGFSQVVDYQVDEVSQFDYTIKEFTLPGGRLFNNVNGIAEGPYGFLWFGTHNGLVRYDGYEFVIHTKIEGDTTSLTDPYIESIYWDRFDKLWIGTNNGGLFRFDPKTEKFTHFKHHTENIHSLSNQTVSVIMEDAKGDLWIGTSKGLNRFNRETEQFERFFADTTKPGSLTHDAIWNLYVDKQGVLWIGTGMVTWQPEPGGLERYSPETNSFVPYLYDSEDNSLWTSAAGGLLEDESGNFWVGTTAGLLKMDREKEVFLKTPNHPRVFNAMESNLTKNASVKAIIEDSKGGMWIGGERVNDNRNNLVRYDPLTKRVQKVLIKGNVWDLLESSDGTIWVVSGGAGIVHKITPTTRVLELQAKNAFLSAFKTTYPRQDSNQFLGPYHLTADTVTGTIWAGGAAMGKNGQVFLINYNPKNKAANLYPIEELTNKRNKKLHKDRYGAYGMGIDKEGNIWATLEREDVGLYRFHPKTKEFRLYNQNRKEKNSLSSNLISCILLDSQGDIWVATYGKGLNRLNPKTGQITHYSLNKKGAYHIGGYFPQALLEDQDGTIWVGGSVYKVNGQPFLTGIAPINNTVKQVDFKQKITNTAINYLAVKQEGSLLLSLSNKGYLFYMPETEFISVHNKNSSGFLYNDIAAILVDKQNVIWTAAHKEGRFTRHNYPDAVQTFKSKSNLPATPREAVLAVDEHIYFANAKGFVDINPDVLTTQERQDTNYLQLTDFYVVGEKQLPSTITQHIWLEKELILPYEAETFAFRFSDFNFQRNDSQFEYRLYPYETNWQKTSGLPQANYNKVAAGNYKFQVRTVSLSDNTEGQQLSLAVKILPPWWRTWWAYSLYGMSVLGLFYFFRRYELNKQKERIKIEREKLAEQRRINAKISKFVPNAFIHSLGRKDIMEIKLGDSVAQEVTVLFSDIRNYTTLAEQMTPEENFQFVNAFNRRMGPIIQQNNGFVNQYLGDAIMALFKNTPQDALKSAIQMQNILSIYNQKRIEKKWPLIKIGIGFHTGSLIMGIIGDEHRMDAATISDSVNIAARIESLTKHYGVSILLSEDSYQQITDKETFSCLYLGKVLVKGKRQPIGIYECYDGDTAEQRLKKKVTSMDFDNGMKAYLQPDFPKAIHYFEKVITQNASDEPAQFFLSKALHYSKQTIKTEWTGVEKMEEK